MASTLFGRPPYAYDSERLVVEVANSVYAVRNHISIQGLRQLWTGLANFINVSLKSHKVMSTISHDVRTRTMLQLTPQAIVLWVPLALCCCHVRVCSCQLSALSWWGKLLRTGLQPTSAGDPLSACWMGALVVSHRSAASTAY